MELEQSCVFRCTDIILKISMMLSLMAPAILVTENTSRWMAKQKDECWRMVFAKRTERLAGGGNPGAPGRVPAERGRAVPQKTGRSAT